MLSRFNYVALVILLSALLFTPLLSFAETEDEKLINSISELLKSGKIDDAIKIAETIKDPDLKKKTLDELAARKAKKYSESGETDNAVTTAETIKDNDLKQKTIDEIADADIKQFWRNWGVGLVVNFDTGHRKPIKTATIVNNSIVRIEEEEDVKYGLGLEIHQFLWSTKWKYAKTDLWSWALAVGPYISVFPGNNNFIDSIGAGVIFGFIGGRTVPKNDAASEKNKLSLNIGIGCYVDPDTQVLANGFEDGYAPPIGETSVRFKKVTQYGVQGVLSFNYKF